MIIDAHAHTRCSDGTQTPAELIAEAAQVGIGVLGLTDHDTTAGWDEAARAAREHGVGLLRGMEVSCRWNGISVHMLSYLHDPQEAELTAVVEEARASRITRTRTIVERLSEDFPISWADVVRLAGEGATIGRPHIADALVEAGVVRERGEAFQDLLAVHSKYFVSLPTVSPVTAVRLIHEAGGAAVFAHPRAAMRGRVVPRAGMREIIDAGLDGLEIDHRDNPEADRRELRELARTHELLITGSSDYHGTGKPNRLGEHSTSRPMLERLAERTHGVDLLV